MQPRSGGKGEKFLLIDVLDADGNTNVALLVVALDHNAYIRPVAVLVHRDIMIRVNMLRDLLQYRVQKAAPLSGCSSCLDYIQLESELSMGKFPKNRKASS